MKVYYTAVTLPSLFFSASRLKGADKDVELERRFSFNKRKKPAKHTGRLAPCKSRTDFSLADAT
jgi:hypothetical protein